ncbi:hypothetical protein H4J51_05495 [Colwellia sp. MB02u-18]|uniref:CsiV family protein n=1 Tax=unclassified Colwellia TaxID=196834 RepID=UPI0015F4BA6D|nr:MULTISPECIES: CsiV family protein [unclassified Colwellia]MBA6223553.1 hypothetical protein [Colwellia sp. MB3u-45]MBA6269090.1 hypothetical protein [Colwellia sp. MB3u-43]MBA6320824.1 hypothetical protein [Colwellia sp. MB02u-19]MBA6324036.1 hypothetical protein [Colwellia sp. MB02u-18]MBA6330972.1 hypothetical protein [Colwellia sp. MB02u-12]
MKLTQLFLCSAVLTFPLTLNATTQENNDRWFDVEIILFSQLGDKSQLKENFPDSSELPKHQRVEDLLNRYLNPDIRTLKQLLPQCDSPHYVGDLAKKNAKLPALFNEKSLVQIAQLTPELSVSNQVIGLGQDSTNLLDSNNNVTQLSADNDTASRHIFTDNTGLNNAGLNREIARADPENNPAISDATINNAIINNNKTTSNSYINAIALPTTLSDEEQANIQRLVLAAEQEFQALKFQYPAKTEPILLCRIDPAYFADYQVENPDFDYHGFSVDKVPLLIDGPEHIDNNKTHLLSKNSLQLNDIIQDLRYSKNFRPMLHMGWRQVARPEKQSVPVKVYAGDNFVIPYQKQLTKFNEQKNQQRSHLLTETSKKNLLEPSPVQNQTEQLQQAKKARLEQIIAQIAQVNENTDELLAALDQQDLSLKLTDEMPLAVTENTPPIAPIQQWFIEGFFNIHLKHYLFITADFNILDKSLAELATARLAPTLPTDVNLNSAANTSTPIQAKAIRFQQNRRVISGEVHYFDHPYMGMIVQIRPYTKPEPEPEQEPAPKESL